MADISLRQSHSLGLDKAKELTKKITTDVKEEFPSLINSISWNTAGTEAKLDGKGFSGVFKVGADSMSIDIDLSFFAKPFKAKVEDKIKGRIAQYFG